MLFKVKNCDYEKGDDNYKQPKIVAIPTFFYFNEYFNPYTLACNR